MARKLREKKKYTLYLGVDQMALAGKLADKAGKSLSSLVGEAMHHLFKGLGLDVPPPEVTSHPEMLQQRADELAEELEEDDAEQT